MIDLAIKLWEREKLALIKSHCERIEFLITTAQLSGGPLADDVQDHAQRILEIAKLLKE